MRTLIALLLFFSSISGFAVLPEGCEALNRLNQILDTHYFNVERDLDTYIRFQFGTAFVDALERLAKKAEDDWRKAHWIDMGAGDARAMRTLLGRDPSGWQHNYDRFGARLWPLLKKGIRIKATAITLKVREKNVTDAPEEGFRILTGRFEKRKNEEIGKADLITDNFGLLPYTSDPGMILQRYVDLSKPDAEILVYLGVSGQESKVVTPKGEVSLREWIGGIEGLEVRDLGEPLWNNPEWDLGFRIRVKGTPKIPKTRFVRILVDREQSPSLLYEEISPSQR